MNANWGCTAIVSIYVLGSGVMSLSNDKTLSHDEPRGLHWGWVVVASGFYCVTMEGGVSDIMIMMIVMLTVILLSAGNSHRDPHGKPQTGFSAREHSHHFTSWRSSGKYFYSLLPKLPNCCCSCS